MKKVIMVNTIKLGCYGKDMRSKDMKNLKMLLDDNKLIYTYNKTTKMFYVLISNLTTYKMVENIYNNFMVDYDKVFMEVYVPADTEEDGLYIIGLIEEEQDELKMDLQLLARNSEVEQDKLKIKEEEKINMENMKNFTIIYKDGKIVNQDTLTSVKQIIELDRLNINVVINNLNNDILLDNTKLVETLVKCDLVEDIESIRVYDEYVDTDLGEYLVFDDYTDAENKAIEQCKQIIEDCGLTENLIFEAEIQGLIDESWFVDFWEETHEANAYEESIQYIADVEELEQLENGEISEDEIRDNYFNSLQDSIKGQEMSEYKYQFGEGQFHDILIKEGLIDICALAQWCVDMDGVAHYLASYDGEEIDENGYYIYRTN